MTLTFENEQDFDLGFDPEEVAAAVINGVLDQEACPYEAEVELILTDPENIRNMNRILGGDPEHKVYKLLDFTQRRGQDIADPWYTGNFEDTYRDVTEGCRGFLTYLEETSL